MAATFPIENRVEGWLIRCRPVWEHNHAPDRPEGGLFGRNVSEPP
jgi:hypothetical protein